VLGSPLDLTAAAPAIESRYPAGAPAAAALGAQNTGLTAQGQIPDRRCLAPGSFGIIMRPWALPGRCGTYGRGMDDKEILAHIDDLIQTEHRLRAQLAAGQLTSTQERAELKAAEVALDQCWDLLRQRRARREFGANPNETAARPAGEVEGYLQ
jgi:hypothetical protein